MYHKMFSQKNFDLNFSINFRFRCASRGAMIFARATSFEQVINLFTYFPANFFPVKSQRFALSKKIKSVTINPASQQQHCQSRKS